MQVKHRLNRYKYRLNHAAGEIGKRLIRWSQRDSNYLRHARDEWAIAFPTNDEMQRQMGEHVLDMVAMFGLEGHSGFSANYARQYIDLALRFAPFSPLTGAESEWGEPYESGGTQQNKRCSHVFRNADGKAYDIDGRIFREPDGTCFTNGDSHVFIEFPYVPTREYVDAEGEPR